MIRLDMSVRAHLVLCLQGLQGLPSFSGRSQHLLVSCLGLGRLKQRHAKCRTGLSLLSVHARCDGDRLALAFHCDLADGAILIEDKSGCRPAFGLS